MTLWLAVCLCALARAQAPAQPATAGRGTLRTYTRLVQVNVVVQDKKGRPVRGLSRGDFTLYDEGEAQQAELLSTGAPSEEKPVSAPGSYSNRREMADGHPTGAIVILLDVLNTPPEILPSARTQLRAFLEKTATGTPVALYALERSPRLLHPLTQDPRKLIPPLERYQAPIYSDLEAAEPKEQNTGLPVDPIENELRRITAPGAMRRRADVTLRSLRTVSLQMGAVLGHKSLIWMAGSFPGWSVVASSFFGLANVSVYPMDVRGMGHTISSEDALPHSWRAAMQGGTQVSASFYTNPTSYSTAMQALAGHTGGRAIFGDNDLARAMTSIFDEERATYVLGFYPTHNDWSSRFRRLKVVVSKPGVRIRHRQGYFAAAEPADDEPTRLARLRLAAESPFQSTAIGLTARMTGVQRAPAGQIRVEVQAEQSEFSLVGESDRREVQVDVLFAQRGADGKLLSFRGESLRMAAGGNSTQLSPGRRFDFRHTLTPVGGAVQVCVVVLDRPSGAMGSIVLPLSPAGSQQPR